MSKRRVVITGLGMVTPLGLDVTETWSGILEGKSGVSAVENFDASAYRSQIAATVKNFDPSPYLTTKEARKLDEYIQYAIAAAAQAKDDAKLEISEDDALRVGVAIGSGIGGLPWIERNYSALLNGGPRKISPHFIPGAIVNMCSGYVSMMYGAKGPNFSVVTACSTGTHNIGMAARSIAYGDVDVMFAGGAEMATCPLGIGGFSAMRALSTRNDDPTRASRPWDKDRDGFVLGEGAGVVILEEYERAKARGATIYAELTGFGMTGDAYHVTLGHSDGQSAAMKMAINDAGLKPEDIDYVNAHGTSTPAGDQVEIQSIKQAFGEHAKNLAVSSTKSMTGHLLGATGAVESIFCILAMRDNMAPPTMNLENPDEGCDLDFVPGQARAMQIDVSLCNSFGFGGTNTSLIFSKV